MALCPDERSEGKEEGTVTLDEIVKRECVCVCV